MREEKIRAAKKLAEAFVERCGDCLREVKETGDESYFAGTRKSGALRRTSLDLTRCLADLRKPN